MSRSSSDCFAEIELLASEAKQDANNALYYLAQKNLYDIGVLIEEAKRRLEYETECKCIVEAEDRKFLDNPDSL